MRAGMRTPGHKGTGRKDEQAGRAALNRQHSNSPIDGLLDRLERVKSTGPDRWIACCPAHDDNTPSLSLRETEDGTVLIKCWAGCGAADVVAAVGLELSDLFPERTGHHYKPKRASRRWIPRDVLCCMADEAVLTAIAAEDLASGRTLAQPDRERLHTAWKRLNAAVREVGRGGG